MKRIVFIIFVLALMMGMNAAKAQQVSPVDFMKMNPYQMKSNPAAKLPYESVMSIAIGNTNLSLQHTGLRYDNFFDFDAQGVPTTLNLRKLANGLNESNFLGINSETQLFTLYRSIGNGMLTFDWGVKVRGDLKFTDDLFKLLAYGNSVFVGEGNPANVDVNLNLNAYREFAVGYQHNINEKLSIGGRAKLLFGLANLATSNANVKLFTDPDSYALRIMENVGVMASLPRVFTLENGVLNANGGFIWSDLFRNVGFGMDLGAEYRFNEHFGVMAAVNDLGFIRWKLNNVKLESKIEDAGQFYDDGSFLFNGLDTDQLQLIISDEYYRERFLDTLKQYFPMELTNADKYTTGLNTNVLLRGYYDIDGKNRFTLQAQGMFYNSGFRPAVTLAYSGSFFKKIDVCASYTVMKDSYDNIGLGLAFNLGVFHIYAASNNVLGLFKPLNTSVLDAQVGIVFNLWKAEKRVADE